MTPFAQFVTNVLALGTIAMQIFIVVLFVSLFIKKDYVHEKRGLGKIVAFVAHYILELGLAVTLIAVLSSLYYSNIVGFPPCELCWWQRIFIYPQVVIFAVAIYYRKKGAPYDMALVSNLILSALGFLVAMFQYYGSTFNQSLLDACSVTGVSCAKQYFVAFGYVTVPIMSLTCFALLLLKFGAHKRAKRTHA